ncbi:MAG TPA: hypothetical protein VK530_07335 [Candidatus Acidoferrum sp.]|nr:hypothetical protein [Candidatus Acidoferrum sp.]
MHLWPTFVELIKTPFQNLELVWGIVPLYFGWILSEITSSKASFRTAVQTGFAFIWAAAQWIYHYAHRRPAYAPPISVDALLAVNMVVTVLVLIIGIVALVSGVRRKFPKRLKFLGHSRFSAYFMIAIFPIQAHYMPWTWERLLAIVVFAVPIWIVVHLGFMPLRK